MKALELNEEAQQTGTDILHKVIKTYKHNWQRIWISNTHQNLHI